jgi:hypothetical protein
MYGVFDGEKVIAQFSTPLEIRSNQPVFVSDSLSLKRSTLRSASQRWEITAPLVPLTHTANDLFVMMVVNGFDKRFDVIVPQNVAAVSQRERRGNTHKASGFIDSTKITVNTLSNIPIGTFIQFDNHRKVYMVVKGKNDKNEVEIYPALRSSVSDTNFKWEDDIIMPVYLETDGIQGIKYIDGIVADNGVMTFLEAL